MNEPLAKTDAHILVAEDSEAQAFKLRHLLSHPPALVIGDVNMPAVDGYELCRRIKADPRLSGIPVVLITSLTDPHEAIKGLQCGASGFLTKPYDESPLLARI